MMSDKIIKVGVHYIRTSAISCITKKTIFCNPIRKRELLAKNQYIADDYQLLIWFIGIPITDENALVLVGQDAILLEKFLTSDNNIIDCEKYFNVPTLTTVSANSNNN